MEQTLILFVQIYNIILLVQLGREKASTEESGKMTKEGKELHATVEMCFVGLSHWRLFGMKGNAEGNLLI